MAEQIEPIFSAFLENSKEAVKRLKSTIAICRHDNVYENTLYLRSLQIQDANTRNSNCFSRATMTAMHTQMDSGFGGGCVFWDGIVVLEGYLNEEPAIPKDVNERKALQRLLEFLSSSHPDLTATQAEKGECCWAMQLAEHLLSKLTVEGSYILDDGYAKPCFDLTDEEQMQMKMKFGDTSFGLSDAWHGSSDILMNSLPVSLAGDGDGDDRSSTTSESSVEVKTHDFKPKDVKQVIAQTIVFSFLQQKNDQNLRHTLVPSIGIGKDALVVFFYDSKYDVLLQSNKLPLFVKDLKRTEVNIPTIVFLWLVLNYKYFCSGIIDEMKDETSGFFQILGKDLEKWQQEVKQPCKALHKNEEDLLDQNAILVTIGTPKLELHKELLKL